MSWKEEAKYGDLWHSKFQDILGELTERRHDRVQNWICNNTTEFSSSNDVQKLQLEVVLALVEMKRGLSVCGCNCSVCFWWCVLEKVHFADHSCMSNHVCVGKCTYCSLELDQENEVEECRNLAGHDGNHNYKNKNHTCMEICSFFDRSSNYITYCCLKVFISAIHHNTCAR